MNSYTYKATTKFWRSFEKLPKQRQASVKRAWDIFKKNPFDLRLKPHKIHSLSTACGCTVYAIVIEQDLRAVFYVDRNVVYSLDIGTHSIYRA
ncbi:MAG: hypothetical protein V1746_00995 [bacterium]